MKMKRNMIVLGVVAVVVVALVFGVLPRLNPKSGSGEATATPAPTVNLAELQLVNTTKDNVSEVTIAQGSASYTLYKQGDNYVIRGRETLPLDQTNALGIVNSVANVTASAVIDANPSDYAQYGLQNPQAKATAKYTDGTTRVFLLGSKLVSGNGYYLMMEGNPKVYSAGVATGTYYLSTAESLLTKEAFTLTAEDITSIKVLKNGEVAMELTTDGPFSKVSVTPWMIVKPWQRAVDTEQLSAYLNGVVGVTMDSVVDAGASDLSKYGLDKPAYDITISGKGKTDELLVGSKKDDSYTYVKFAGSNTVYAASTSTLSFTDITAYKLADKTILLVNISSAVAVKFQGLGTNEELTIVHTPTKDDKGEVKKDTNGNTMYDQTFNIGGKSLEEDVSRYFYQVCIGLTTHSLVAKGWQPAAGVQPVATLTYVRNSDPTEIKIEFLPYDNDFYAVRMNGEANFLIKKEKVKTVADDFEKLKAGTLTVPKS